MVSQQLRLVVVQSEPSASDYALSRARIEGRLEGLKPASCASLILLPEMFSSGFQVNPPESLIGDTPVSLEWMRGLAERHDALVCGSLVTPVGGHLFNRLYLVDKGGEVGHYDKRRLFFPAGEGERFTPGSERVVVEYAGWRILPQVCFDLRFPELARCHGDYDLLLYAAAFPGARHFAWRQLLIARAIENQCYLAAANRVGNDPDGTSYRGDSCLLDFRGQAIATASPNSVSLIEGLLDIKEIADYRKRHPFLEVAP